MNKECFDEIKLQNKEENSDNDELNYDNNLNELKKFWESINFKPALKNSNS